MFINHTNHPSARWGEEQKQAAEIYGGILDVPFPNIPPEMSGVAVAALAEEEGSKILSMNPSAVLCQGEFTYSYHLIRFLKSHGILVLAACSMRDVREWEENRESHKSVIFRFVQFRAY